MDSPHGAAVTAEDFGLKGPRGWAFRGVSVEADPGSLIAVEGPSGSGRTCLLLALTGRMKPTEGHAEVGGLRLPRKMAAARRISALGPVPGVSDLDPSLTVDEHLRERALLQRRFDGSLRALLRPGGERAASARSRVEEALEAAGLDLDSLPKQGRTSVRDLERLEALRLSVALALIGRPRLLALDDTDLKLSDADRAEAWGLLRTVATEGTTVLAVCSEAPEDAVVIRTGASGAVRRNASGTPDAAAPHDAPGEPSGTSVPTKATGTTAEPETGTKVAGATAIAAEDDGKPATDAEPGTETSTTADAGTATGTGTTTDTGTTTTTNTDTDTDTDKTTTEEGAADAIAETGRA
ncbi:ATP-binding cassette domain-containing protein [Streptomyces sp. NPDC059909]|uniref:ATP-binding cassette domain-containing protein n=1 Tax=Streptomyces sp. NPDC059909 TaxID=3346998 RepID=UPI00364B5B6C